MADSEGRADRVTIGIEVCSDQDVSGPMDSMDKLVSQGGEWRVGLRCHQLENTRQV